jgi:hypothetical protein
MDSEIAVRGKGHAEISSRATSRSAENGVGNYAGSALVSDSLGPNVLKNDS